MSRFFALILLVAPLLAVAETPSDAAAEASSAPTTTPVVAPEVDKNELVKIDTKLGKGKTAVEGVDVVVNYTGWFYNPSAPSKHGAKFDSSIGRGPFTFKLGARRVIRGWDLGVEGMKIGGKRTLIIPSEFAYGKRGIGGVIPPDAALIFDVELLDIQ